MKTPPEFTRPTYSTAEPAEDSPRLPELHESFRVPLDYVMIPVREYRQLISGNSSKDRQIVMLTERVFKEARAKEEALAFINSESSRHYLFQRYREDKARREISGDPSSHECAHAAAEAD